MKFELNCFNSDGTPFKEVLSFEGKERGVSSVGYSRVVRVLLNHMRQASSSTKTRGEVSMSKKKPWKQKGTGRARVGSARSPLWRKGGIIFGPKPGCTRLKVNKKERRGVLGQLIRDRLVSGDFVGIDLPEHFENKRMTSGVNVFLKKLGLIGSNGRLIFLLSSADFDTFRKVRNVEGVEVVFYDQIGVLELSRKGKIVFMNKDKELMVEAFKKWM